MRARPDVLYAEPNLKRYKDTVPNDPRYGNLWGVKNTGQPEGTAAADIKADRAFHITNTSTRAASFTTLA